MDVEPTDQLFDRLKNSPRLKEIIGELIEGENVFVDVVRYLAHVPESWQWVKGETIESQRRRRDCLASEIRALVYKMKNDPDAKHVRVFDSKSIFVTPVEDDAHPTAADYLNDVATYLERIETDPTTEMLSGTRNKRLNTLEKYAPSQIKRIIHSFPLNKPNPNSEIAEIVTIVFPQLIVTPDDIGKRKI